MVVVRRHTRVSLSSLGVLLELWEVLMDLEEGHLRGEICMGGTMVITRHLSWGVLMETLRTNMNVVVEVTA